MDSRFHRVTKLTSIKGLFAVGDWGILESQCQDPNGSLGGFSHNSACPVLWAKGSEIGQQGGGVVREAKPGVTQRERQLST